MISQSLDEEMATAKAEAAKAERRKNVAALMKLESTLRDAGEVLQALGVQRAIEELK
ncbi:MAG: hypothetical protein K2X38_08755 [Gemmataceae bacterium]|nr:hypothetical protein [Gemmataceae bacterium]